MANTFKNYTYRDIGSTLTTVHTAPAATQTTIIGMTVANKTASAIKVSVALNDGTADTYIVGGATPSTTGADIAVGGSLVVVGGEQKLVLEAGDTLKVICNAATSADCILSVLEIT